MITYIKGDIFSSNAQVLTNPVNTVGVMGVGLALKFKERYPEMFLDYKRRCGVGEISVGKLHLWEDEQHQILLFPTKKHWRNASRIEYIEEGLKSLANNYKFMGINSIAIPKLGCGHGGLEWGSVKPLIEKHLGSLLDLDVYVYESF